VSSTPPGSPPNAAAQAAITNGDSRLASGSLADVKSAIALYEEAVKADPTHVIPRAKLGEAITRSARFTDDAKTAKSILGWAEDVLADALALDFQDVPARNAMQLVAAARYSLTADATPETRTLLLEGDDLFAKGDHRAALRSYEKITLLDSNHFTAMKYAGNCHYALGDFAAAEETLKRAISIQPLDAQAYLFLFDALSKQKKIKEMFTAAYGAVAAQPLYWSGWFRLSDVLFQAKRPLARMRLKPPGQVSKHPKKPSLVFTPDPSTPEPLVRVWEAYIDEASAGIRDKKTAFKQERDALLAMIAEAKSRIAKGATFASDIASLIGLEDPELLAGATYVLRFKDSMRIEFESWKRETAASNRGPAFRVELFINKAKLRPI
jgi:tetratricopeptide (TPR) repeat protein